MYKTAQLIDMLKAFKGLPSDYAAAHYLGVTTQSISKYRCKRTFCEDNVAYRLAIELNLYPLVVVASIRAERAARAGDETLFSFWSEYATGG
jgi:hypothetical protein